MDFLFNFKKEIAVLGTDGLGVSLCLVSPPLSGRLRNEFSGLMTGAAFDFKRHREGRMGDRPHEAGETPLVLQAGPARGKLVLPVGWGARSCRPGRGLIREGWLRGQWA